MGDVVGRDAVQVFDGQRRPAGLVEERRLAPVQLHVEVFARLALVLAAQLLLTRRRRGVVLAPRPVAHHLLQVDHVSRRHLTPASVSHSLWQQTTCFHHFLATVVYFCKGKAKAE